MLKAILFDLDGTLLDTSEFIFQAYEHTLTTHGFETINREKLSPHIGRGLRVIYSMLAPSGDPRLLMETHDAFQSKNFHLVKSFPKALDVINKLKKMKLKVGIVTSRRKNTKTTMESGGLNPKIFDVIITAEEVENLKPNPEGVILALKRLKVKPEEALFIGDASVDMEMAKNAKVKTVGLTWGFGGKSIYKAKPNYVIDKIEDLLSVVE